MISEKYQISHAGSYVHLTLFIIVDDTIYIDMVSMKLSILYFKGLPVKISIIYIYISIPEDCFPLSNSADPVKIPPYVAFHLGLHCLPKYL